MKDQDPIDEIKQLIEANIEVLEEHFESEEDIVLQDLREASEKLQKLKPGPDEKFTGTVTTLLTIKDVAGDFYKEQYEIGIPQDKTSSEVLKEFNDRVREQIEGDFWFKFLTGGPGRIQSKNIVSYKVTRERKNSVDSAESSGQEEGETGE